MVFLVIMAVAALLQRLDFVCLVVCLLENGRKEVTRIQTGSKSTVKTRRVGWSGSVKITESGQI